MYLATRAKVEDSICATLNIFNIIDYWEIYRVLERSLGTKVSSVLHQVFTTTIYEYSCAISKLEVVSDRTNSSKISDPKHLAKSMLVPTSE